MIRETFDKRVFIGDAIAARDLSQIYAHQFDAVIDLAANESPAQLGRDLVYCRFPLSDDGANDDALVSTAISCLRLLLRNNHKVLVACSAGMSRSPTIVAAALSIESGNTIENTISNVLRGAPRDVSPVFFAAVRRVASRMTGE